LIFVRESNGKYQSNDHHWDVENKHYVFKKSQLHSNHDKLCMSSLLFGFVIITFSRDINQPASALCQINMLP